MTARTPHPIEQLFPARRVHLVGGSSGSGKTTWILQMLETWSKGEKPFGYIGNPQPFLIISYDRGEEEFVETCSRLHLPESRFPRFIPHGAAFGKSLIGLLTDLRISHPAVRLFVIEGIALKVPAADSHSKKGNLNDYNAVGTWLSELRRFCEVNDITIIGVVHSPKTHEGEGYVDPRTRISGSGAWGAFSSTLVLVEKASPNDPGDATRKLYFLPRNGPERLLLMDFRDGMLVEKPKNLTSEQKIIEYCTKRELDTIYSFEDLRGVTGLSIAQVEKIISNLVSHGRLIRLDARGKYRFKPASANA